MQEQKIIFPPIDSYGTDLDQLPCSDLEPRCRSHRAQTTERRSYRNVVLRCIIDNPLNSLTNIHKVVGAAEHRYVTDLHTRPRRLEAWIELQARELEE